MKNIKTLERLQQLHQRILQENTGPPKSLANQMKISERSLYRLIEQLKDLHASVEYSRSMHTYYYSDDFELRVTISVKALSKNEVIEVFGGSYFINKDTQLQGFGSRRLYFS